MTWFAHSQKGGQEVAHESAVSIRGQVAAAWIDGRETPPEDARISVATHGLHYATAVFDGIRSYEARDGKVTIFRLQEHMRRLVLSARAIGIKSAFTAEELSCVAKKLVWESGLRDTYIRPIIFLGEGIGLMQDELPVHTAVLVLPWTAGQNNGLRLCVSRFRRPHPNSTVITAKTSGHYESSRLAALEARQNGYDDALQLDHEGLVAETSVANIFLVKDNVVITPDEGRILPGFTRDTVTAILESNGHKHEERTVSVSELFGADEIFVAGTAAEITPVIMLNGHFFQVGSITQSIRDTYQKVVRGKGLWLWEPNWVTYV